MAGIGSMKPVKLIEIIQSQDINGRNQQADGAAYEIWANVKRKGAGFDYKSGLTNLEETLEFKINFRFNYNPDSLYKIVYLGNKHQVKSVARVDESLFNWLIVASAKHS